MAINVALHIVSGLGFVVAFLWWHAEGGFEPLLACLSIVASFVAWLRSRLKAREPAWNRKRLEKHFPVNFGDKREAVHEKLGAPQRRTKIFDAYYSHGVVLYYDLHESVVDGVMATRLQSGTAYSGTVRGVRIGDSSDQVIEQLGTPMEWGLPYQKLSVASWELEDDRLLFITFVRRLEPGESRDQLGTVRNIILCRPRSYIAFEPVVAIAIEEIRSGLVPTKLESRRMALVSFEESFWHEDYDIVNFELQIMGGANVYAVFEGGQVAMFWIYPLGGAVPVIRAVDRYHEEKEEWGIRLDRQKS